jgi:hypothetical protein
MQRERAARLARELVERSPAGAVDCIFAGGSLGREEVWAADVDGVAEIYSDVDLYVVAHDQDAAGIVRAAAAGMRRAERGEAHFVRAADIGVYTRADLTAQPLRPGTADLDANHLLLYGDGSIPRALVGRDAASIPPEEALYLLENRAMELSRDIPPGSTAETRLALAQALKSRLDVYAAHAIVAGTFVSTHAARARAFTQTPPSTLDAAERSDISEAFTHRDELGAWVIGRDAVAERDRASAALAHAWRTLAPLVLRTNESLSALVARRCHDGAALANARELLRIRRATGVPGWRAALAASIVARLAPAAALRIDALVRVFSAQDEADSFRDHFVHVDRLTRLFGFNQGSLEARVRAMHAAIS